MNDPESQNWQDYFGDVGSTPPPQPPEPSTPAQTDSEPVTAPQEPSDGFGSANRGVSDEAVSDQQAGGRHGLGAQQALPPIVPPQQLNESGQGVHTAESNPVGDLSDPTADYFSTALPAANADIARRHQQRANEHLRRLETPRGQTNATDLPAQRTTPSGHDRVADPATNTSPESKASPGPLASPAPNQATADPATIPTQVVAPQAQIPAQAEPTSHPELDGAPAAGPPLEHALSAAPQPLATTAPVSDLHAANSAGQLVAGSPELQSGSSQPLAGGANPTHPQGEGSAPGSLPSAQASQRGGDVNPPVGPASSPPDLSLGAATSAASTHRQGDDAVPSSSGNAGSATPNTSAALDVDSHDGLAIVHTDTDEGIGEGTDQVTGTLRSGDPTAPEAASQDAAATSCDDLVVRQTGSPGAPGAPSSPGSPGAAAKPDTTTRQVSVPSEVSAPREVPADEADTSSDTAADTPAKTAKADKPARPAWLELLREIGIVVGAALLISLTIKTFLFQMFYIPSPSMSNTLAIGDRVVVSQLTPGLTDLKRGDIIVFRDPGNWLPPKNEAAPGPWTKASTTALTFVGILPNDNGQHLIKRIVGMPGDVVTCCDGEGKIRINGKPVDEPYLSPGSLPSEVAFEIHVPKDSYWVLGDNRQQSKDSRYNMDQQGFGTVPHSEVVGRAVMIAWPAGRWTWLSNHQDAWARVPNPSNTPATAKTSAPAMPGEQNP